MYCSTVTHIAVHLYVFVDETLNLGREVLQVLDVVSGFFDALFLVGEELIEQIGREVQTHGFDKQLELAELGGLLGYRCRVDKFEVAAELVDVDAVVCEARVIVALDVNDAFAVVEFFEDLVEEAEVI